MAGPDSRSSRSFPRVQIGLLLLAAVLIAGAVFNFQYVQRELERTSKLETIMLELREFYESVSQSARESSQGLEPDRGTLFAIQDSYIDLNLLLTEGDPQQGIEPLPEVYDSGTSRLDNAWERVSEIVEEIIAGLPTAQRTKVNSGAINALVDDFNDPATALVEGSRGEARMDAALLRANVERLRAVSSRMIQVNARAVEEAEVLGPTMAAAEARYADLQGNTSAAFAEAMATIGDALEGIRPNVDALIAAAPRLDEFNNASFSFFSNATRIRTAAGDIENLLLSETQGEQPSALPSYLMGAGALLSLLAFIGLFVFQLRREATVAKNRDRRQQDAILTLLDEISNLADGDLTLGVTVTEDFTGAIADSINFTVENMRGLVGQINAASQQIAEAAEQTQGSVQQMSRQSEEQARETDEATQTITRVSQSLEETAGRATQASSQAQESVRVAQTGTKTVDRTIEGMNALREQIQDTSKRMKRLGESSQEIGNITELINDIAEQTNTLALNASIQAAMAGEAGRGFAVVADEVQRLAERATNATRQIENLVKTIQADTNEAIVSMERSTSNVVSGASTAEEAGQTLTQIERASTDLAGLIDEIATSVRSRAGEGTEVASTMQRIREVAVQTASSSRQTAQDVGTLTELSATLRESVTGFTIPESDHPDDIDPSAEPDRDADTNRDPEPPQG